MRSSDRLLDIIEELVRGPGQQLTELSESVGLPKPTVLRFLRSLEEREWVARLPDGTYEIGPHLGTLVGVTAPRDPILGQAAPYLAELRDELDESIGLVSVVGRSRMCVLGYSSSQAHRFVYEPYVKRRLHAGASGKVLLAFGAPSLRLDILRHPMESYTDATLTTSDALDAELDRVRTDGWAMSKGERCEGSVAVAVPLRDAHSGRVHALTVLAPQERFNPIVQRLWLDELRACAASIEAASSGIVR